MAPQQNSVHIKFRCTAYSSAQVRSHPYFLVVYYDVLPVWYWGGVGAEGAECVGAGGEVGGAGAGGAGAGAGAGAEGVGAGGAGAGEAGTGGTEAGRSRRRMRSSTNSCVLMFRYK